MDQVSADGGRVPDFLIIGAMKSGTTTVFRWLEEHPGTRLPEAKEPHYFSRDDVFARGVGPYLALFADVPDSLVTGEASASYADPRIAARVAERVAALAPDVRLVYLVRDPVARLKSHYLHEWQRSRERRPFAEAVAAPDNPYVAMSRYADAAAPFVAELGPERLLVVGTEELAGPDSPGWRRVTDHLGLTPRAGSPDRANVTADKVAFSPFVLRLWESGLLHHLRRLPGPVRRLARRASRGATDELQRQAALVADAEVQDDVAAMLAEQLAAVRR